MYQEECKEFNIEEEHNMYDLIKEYFNKSTLNIWKMRDDEYFRNYSGEETNDPNN